MNHQNEVDAQTALRRVLDELEVELQRRSERVAADARELMKHPRMTPESAGTVRWESTGYRDGLQWAIELLGTTRRVYGL